MELRENLMDFHIYRGSGRWKGLETDGLKLELVEEGKS